MKKFINNNLDGKVVPTSTNSGKQLVPQLKLLARMESRVQNEK